MTTERLVADLVRRVESRFYGKYRGLVVDNADPEGLGRLRMRVPPVLGLDVVTGWALPCSPYGGAPDQGLLCVPEVGAGVWAEFEGGDPEFPIWSGTFWSKPGDDSELPRPNDPDGAPGASVQDPPSRKILKTRKGHTIQLEDADDEEMILIVEGEHGHVIALDGNGITVTDGANGHVIRLDGNGITVTDGANDHEITLDSTGIAITDGRNDGNAVRMAASGVTVEDANGNAVVLGASGVQIGSSTAVEKIVLGTTLAANVASFLASLATHTHVGNLGAPTSPPVAPMQLQVPLSAKNTVE